MKCDIFFNASLSQPLPAVLLTCVAYHVRNDLQAFAFMKYLFLNGPDLLLFKASSVTDISVGYLKDSCQPATSSQGSIFSFPLLQGAMVALTGLRAKSVPVSVFFSIFHDLNVIGTHDDGYFS